jgi:hypothetical protein
MYADNIGLVAQGNSFEQLEDTLNEDLKILQNYFLNRCLTLNANKTTAVTFHLNNREEKRELQLKIDETNISNEECPKYLGIKLDRTLTFKQHLDSTKNKLKSRNNIIGKLAGTSWGCNASTLRTLALSLVFNVAEYCAPVWMRITHCKKIDIQLNVAMSTITGIVRSTPTQWLPVLAHIDPQKLRDKELPDDALPIYNDLLHHPNKRLKSRHPIWEDHLWTTLNRIRNEQGKCNYLLHKWGMVESPLCGCGQIQTIRYIVNECPITKYAESFEEIHSDSDDAIKWMENLDVCL